MRCAECGFRGELAIDRRDVEYQSLPGVVLRNVEHRTCPECGDVAIVIPSPAQLNQVLARELVRKNGPLTPDEFRFLRKVLGWSSRDTAKRLGVQPETISRWENGKRAIPPPADRALRLCVVKFEPIDDYGIELLEYGDAASSPSPVGLEFASKTWRACA